ncbi:hypothetical protein LTR17_001892 [Elasticomyces elasticus]|nr:hypothetical protein LTR17_001892 [Elasticomyces elasticus]
MNAEAYRYQPLANYDIGGEIRLLKIHPGSANDVLRLQLFIVDRRTTIIEYDALSYMWGSDDNLQIAFMDDKLVSLRENLSSFLRHHRDTPSAGHQVSYLWIDALCINQEDPNEKMMLVRHMYRIYTQFEAFLEHPFGTKRNTKPVIGPRHHSPQKQHQISTDDENALHPIEIHASQIIQSPYWGRLWIVQEIKLAAKASIVCGSELLPLACMTRLTTHVDSGLFNLTRHVSRKQLELFRFATSTHEVNHTWAHYVVACRDHLCSEPQDHVLGLLGLANWLYEPLILHHGCSLGWMMLAVLECSINQHQHRDEEYDTLAIMHQLSTVLSVGTRDLLEATQKRGVRNGKSFILAFDDVIEIFCGPSQPQIPDSGGGPLRYPPHGAMWIFACESVAMHIDGRGPYLCFGPRHASVRWYPKATSGLIQNTVSEVGNLAMEPTIIYLRHWRSSPFLLDAARSWMEAKQTNEPLEGAHEAQESKHFCVTCSFLAFTELYGAFRTLAGLPD